jgi:hypothetical protein
MPDIYDGTRARNPSGGDLSGCRQRWSERVVQPHAAPRDAQARGRFGWSLPGIRSRKGGDDPRSSLINLTEIPGQEGDRERRPDRVRTGLCHRLDSFQCCDRPELALGFPAHGTELQARPERPRCGVCSERFAATAMAATRSVAWGARQDGP